MNRLFHGTIYHSRLTPVEHTFSYPAGFIAIDLDHVPATRLFSHNRWRIFSLRDADHLDNANETLAAKARRFIGPPVERIVLCTVPRVFGYVFNPVSFYIGYDRDHRIVAALAEVNNTFGERHVYALHQPQAGPDGAIHFTAKKAFHVSPFNDRLLSLIHI